MNFETIKHSVILITYNQENYIDKALQSVLEQDPMPFEIIIGDDASTDNTSKIVIDYQNKYPTIIKIYRHNENQGIFKNFNSLMDKVNGDVISCLAGDDFYKPGLFYALNKAINDNNLNPLTDSLTVVTNTIHQYSSGKETIFNNYRIRENSMFKERLRYGLSYREVGLSRKLWNSIDPIPLEFGIYGDWLFGFDLVVKCKLFVFINQAFSVYVIGVGVTSNTKVEEFAKSRLLVLREIQNRYLHILDTVDKQYIEFEKCKIRYISEPSISNYFSFMFRVLLNANNFSMNNSFIQHLKLLLPDFIKRVIRKLLK